MSKIKINKTPVETRLAIERRSAAMLPDRPTQAGFKPWDIRNALFTAIIADKGACIMGEIDRIVDETNAAIDTLKEKVTTAGSVTIPASEWTDTLPKLAYPEQPVLAKGTVAILMPGNTASQNAARKAKITVQAETYGDGKIIVQREDGVAPTGNITLDYIIIKVDDSEAPPRAALIGVDAYGETEEPISVDLSGFAPDENNKGRIVETYADRTVVTELTYDETGRITKIGDTTLEWGEE